MKKMKNYVISTDDSTMEGDFTSLAEALDDFFDGCGPTNLNAFEQYLERLGGYGWIEVDGIRVASVRP